MDKIDELRKKLKDDREQRGTDDIGGDGTGNGDSTAPSTASRDIKQYAPNIPDTDGHSIQPVSGPGAGIVRVIRAVSDTKGKFADLPGSPTPGNSRDGHTTRRSRKHNGESGPDGTNLSASPERQVKRTVGSLETDEPIPARTFATEEEDKPRALYPIATPKTEPTTGTTSEPRKRGRPATKGTLNLVAAPEIAREVKAERKTPKFLTGPTFSKQEAKELQEPLIAALNDEFLLADKALWKLVNDPLEQPVWSDISEKEMESLTNIVLRLGQRNPLVASVARTAIDGSDYITAGVVLAPRFVQTAKIIKTARIQRKLQNENLPRQSRVERIRNRRRRVTTPTD